VTDTGFSEADLQDFAKSERFLAAAHAYSLDRINLGHAVFLVKDDSRAKRIHRELSSLVFSGLFHEVAKRIRDGKIVVRPALERAFPSFYHPSTTDEIPLIFTYGVKGYDLKFSEVEQLPENPFRIWRQSFGEEDIQELAKDRRFLACIDAWQKCQLTWKTVRDRMLGPNATHGPRDLAYKPLLDLAFKMAERIRSGTIVVPGNLREEFAFAYEPEPPESYEAEPPGPPDSYL
jgi:hypothetical protein